MKVALLNRKAVKISKFDIGNSFRWDTQIWDYAELCLVFREVEFISPSVKHPISVITVDISLTQQLACIPGWKYLLVLFILSKSHCFSLRSIQKLKSIEMWFWPLSIFIILHKQTESEAYKNIKDCVICETYLSAIFALLRMKIWSNHVRF